MKKFITIVLFLFISSTLNVYAETTIDEAKEAFNAFVDLSNNYKEEVSYFYTDDTKIKRMLLFNDGRKLEITLDLEEYRKKINFYRKLAMLIRYKLHFTEVNYFKEGENVRVKGQRRPFAKKETLPFEMLFGEDEKGFVRIKEELFYTRSVKYFKKQIEQADNKLLN